MERLENYFVAHDVKTEAKKRLVLLSECGVATYKLIKSLLAPQKPSDEEYKVLLEKAKQQFAPVLSCIVEHHKFNTHVQQPGELIALFVAQLRALLTHIVSSVKCWRTCFMIKSSADFRTLKSNTGY